jgi:hypothetical protein
MSQSIATTRVRIDPLRLVPTQLGSDSHAGGSMPPESAWRHHVAMPPANPTKARLLDQVRDAIRTRHYSYRTEEAYVGWVPFALSPVEGFILFHRKRHPAEMGPVEITQFLTALAVDRQVSASTQNQALAAILFL